MTTFPSEVTTPFGVHRYAAEHWAVLHPFVEGALTDPKGIFSLASDTWTLWPYARNGTPSQEGRYRINFAPLRSFLKPFVKWYCYQQVLQRAGNVRAYLRWLPNDLKHADEYLLNQRYTSLDDLAPLTAFEDLWASLLPDKDPPFFSREVQLQRMTRSFWLQIHAIFGVPLLVPPITPLCPSDFCRNRR